MDSEHHLNGLSENAVDVSVKKATSKFFVSMLHEPRKPFKHRIRLSRVSAALLLQRRKLLFVEVHFSKASTAALPQRRISLFFYLSLMYTKCQKGVCQKKCWFGACKKSMFFNDLESPRNSPIVWARVELEKIEKKSQKWYFFQNPELNDHSSWNRPFSQNHKGILQFWSLKRSSAKGGPFAHFHRFRHNSMPRCHSSCGKRFVKNVPKHGLLFS